MASETDRKRSSDGDYLWVVGIVVLAFFWPRISVWGSAKLEEIAGSEIAARVQSAAPILLAGLIVLAVLLLVRGIVRGARRRKRDILSSVLAPMFGASDVRIRIAEWTSAPDDPPGGHPLRIEVDYDPTTRDASPNWRRRLETVVALKVPPGDARWWIGIFDSFPGWSWVANELCLVESKRLGKHYEVVARYRLGRAGTEEGT